MFESKGMVVVPQSDSSEEDIFLIAADAGAEDIQSSEGSIEVVTAPEAVTPVNDALEAAGIMVESSEVTLIPKTTIPVEGSDAKKLLHLIDALEELDDVQDVYANFDISDEVLESVAS
jgi:transcriptional/translational regulatory protein YebC/TACO1